MWLSVRTRPDCGRMRTKLKGGSLCPMLSTIVWDAGSDSVGGKRAVRERGLSAAEDTAHPGTIFSPDGQFSLMSDHPAVNGTDLQLQIQSPRGKLCLAPAAVTCL